MYLKQEQNTKSSAVRIAHVTYPFVGNAGDTYLSYCVRKFLEFDAWDIINVSDAVTEETIDRINRTNGLVIGGGGLFLPDTNANTISGWQWAIPDRLLDCIKVPVYVYSVGYNYFNGQEPDLLFIDSINKLVEKAEYVGLRNTGSVRAIQKLLPDNLKEKVIFQPCTTTFASRFLPELKHTEKSNIIAVNMAFDRSERRFGEEREMVCHEVAKAIKRIEGDGFEIICVAHCDDDFEFLTYLDDEKVAYKKMNLSYRLPDEIIKFYLGVHTVIGMRGHSQMIPFGLDCNIITLGSHNKMKWFLEDTDFMDMYVDLSKSNKIKFSILKAFNYIENNAKEVTSRRNLAIDKLYQISMDNKKLCTCCIKR